MRGFNQTCWLHHLLPIDVSQTNKIYPEMLTKKLQPLNASSAVFTALKMKLVKVSLKKTQCCIQ